MSTTRLTLLFLFCSIPNALAQYFPYQLYQPYQYVPYLYDHMQPPLQRLVPQPTYPIFRRYVERYPSPTADPPALIPTEIIDFDEKVISTETATFPTANVSPETRTERRPYIVESHTQQYTSNVNPNKNVHIFENNPKQTVILRTFMYNGRAGKNVISINMVNGVEVTSTTERNSIRFDERAKSQEDDAEEEDEDNKKEDDSDPKPVDS